MSFLKAEWRKLIIANYEIDPKLLSKYLPYGTEPDLWKGKCYVSLVGFMFLNTRLLGIKIPFHVNFEEVNLRFYVKREENNELKRGVVFIKEIVPKPALSFVANTIYNENYESLPMRHNWISNKNNQEVEYQWKKGGNWHKLKVTADRDAISIDPNSKTEFITEHYWGYAKVNQRTSNEYEVTHPTWKVYEVLDYQIDVDFGLVYGDGFEIFNNTSPSSVMLAEGSHITVENKRRIM